MTKRKKSPFRGTWKDYLAFSTRERNGMYALLFILAIQICLTFYLNFSKPVLQVRQTTWLSDEANSWMQTRKTLEVQSRVKEEFTKEIEKQDIKPFQFNPNSSTIEDFQLLGLNLRQARMIDKFRSRGGKFKTKNDFKKMYCISPDEYLILEPWIDLPDTLINDTRSHFGKKEPKTFLIIDLALADTTELIKLPGIGPSFARRIMKWRTKLGGFYSLEQVREVWGMTDSLYLLILPHLSLSDSIPGSINLNTIGIEEFGKHPYVGFSMARIILNYRDQHGPFASIEKLKNVPLVTEEIFRKLAPYLVIEEK